VANHDQDDPMRWLWRGLAALLVVVGWFFIFWQNEFHFGPPTVFLALAYFALVGVIYNLWRVGSAAVAVPSVEDEADDSTWGKPIGAVGELEREKKTLIKAIKEAEFDREMGKLSDADAAMMIGQYRARAIEVIKEIERLSGKSTATKREEIEREIRARLELADKPKKAAKKAAAAAAKKKTKKASGLGPQASGEASEKTASGLGPQASGETSAPAKAPVAPIAPDIEDEDDDDEDEGDDNEEPSATDNQPETPKVIETTAIDADSSEARGPRPEAQPSKAVHS
jgi:hypothetical protein